VLCNARYRAMYPAIAERIVPGVRFEEILRANVASGSLPDAAADEEAWIAERLRQFRNPGRDREERAPGGAWYRYSERRTEDGGLVALRSDITRDRQREAALQESEARYRQLVEHSPDAVIVHADERIVYANPSAARMLGAEDAEALLGHSLLELVPEAQRDFVRGRIRKMLTEWRSLPTIEGHIRRLDGGMIDIEATPMPLLYGGKPSIQLIARDVTARKRTQEMLELTQLSMDRASEGMLWLDADGHVRNVNDSACRMLGYRRGELLALSVFELNPELTREAWEKAWLAIKADGSRSFEAQLRTKRSSPLACDIVMNHLRFGGRELQFALLRDASSRRATERKLRTAMERAEAASRAKSEFLANMSHELRTPLNAIIGFSEVMRGELFGAFGNSRYLEYAADIHDSGMHLLTMINDILDLSRAEAGELTLNDQEVDLRIAALAAARLVRDRAAAAALTVSVELEEDLPRLRADERMVKQMLINLLSNAVKFTPDAGRITVTARLEANGGLALMVRDTGVGMAPEDIPVALTPFRQIESLLTRKHGGTGLGLPLVKSLVELHGGKLGIESQPGTGTAVTLRFPPARVVPAAAPARRVASLA
jgi:PAS domain S-box-containing protein